MRLTSVGPRIEIGGDMESRFNIGDLVSLNMGDESMPVGTAKVVAVTFTEDKVLYDIALMFHEGEYGINFYPVAQRVDSILIGPA